MAWPPGATKVDVWSQGWRVPDFEVAGKHRGRRGQTGFPEEETLELSSKEEVKRRLNEGQAHHRLQPGPGGPQIPQGIPRGLTGGVYLDPFFPDALLKGWALQPSQFHNHRRTAPSLQLAQVLDGGRHLARYRWTQERVARYRESATLSRITWASATRPTARNHPQRSKAGLVCTRIAAAGSLRPKEAGKNPETHRSTGSVHAGVRCRGREEWGACLWRVCRELLCNSHPPLAGERLDEVCGSHTATHYSPGADLQPLS